MKNIILAVILILLGSRCVSGQDTAEDLQELRQKFREFDYRSVIQTSDSLLIRAERYSPAQLVEIYRLRAMAFYSSGQSRNSMIEFIKILNLDSNFQLDSARTSPKIVHFYREIKEEFLANMEERSPDTSIVVKRDTIYLERGTSAGSITKSIILPGWGHIAESRNRKGIILGVLGLGSLAGSIYYATETHAAERDYLNETDPDLIESYYKDYNRDYKIRNVFLISYGIVWLYSQFDLIYSAGKFRQSNSPIELKPVMFQTAMPVAGLGLMLRLNSE